MTTPTLEDYWRAVDGFVAGMSPLGDDLEAILLSGSMARNEAIPGDSDLLDAVVVVRRGLLDERKGFSRVVEQILAACEPLARSGLPFSHPPFFYAEDELDDLEDLYRGYLVSTRSCQVLCGRDLRPAFLAGPGATAVARCVLLAMERRFMHPLSVFLLPWELSKNLQDVLFQRLVRLWKYYPLMACVALGLPIERTTPIESLRPAFSHLDFSVFDEIHAIRRGDHAAGPEELRGLLRRAFDLGERVNEKLHGSGMEPWGDLLVFDDAMPPPREEAFP
jgi:hypothetical protein